MLKSKLRSTSILILFLSMMALGACSGEIPPELLEAAAAVQSNVELGGELEFDLSSFADELEFTGEVQAIADTEWAIAGLSFLVDPTTEIKGSPQVGDQVKVHATLTSEGALLAREIEPAEGEGAFTEDSDDALPFDLGNELEFVGIVDSTGATVWMISGRPVVILPMTEIKGLIEVGDLVKVHAFLNENGELAAREIEPAIEDDGIAGFAFNLEHEFEFVGMVETIADSSWIVAGRTILVLPETEIVGLIVEGDLVKVHAFLNPAGELAAREIEPALGTALDDDDMDDDGDLKLTGIVQEISDGTWVVAGVAFHVTVDTEIDGDIKVGDLVEVYFFDDEGANIAREIELEDDSDDASDDSDDDLDDGDDDLDDDEDDDDDDEHEDEDDERDDD